MKNIIFIFLGIIVCCNHCFAVNDCAKGAEKAHNEYYDANKDKVITDDEFNRLDKQKQKEAKIRELCFMASLNWHLFCAVKDCGNENLKIDGHSLDDICKYAKIDCFNDNIDTVLATLEESNDSVVEMFYSNIDEEGDFTLKMIQKEENPLSAVSSMIPSGLIGGK